LVCASESIAAEYIPLPSDIQDVNVVNPVITGFSPVPYADSVMGDPETPDLVIFNVP